MSCVESLAPRVQCFLYAHTRLSHINLVPSFLTVTALPGKDSRRVYPTPLDSAITVGTMESTLYAGTTLEGTTLYPLLLCVSNFLCR